MRNVRARRVVAFSTDAASSAEEIGGQCGDEGPEHAVGRAGDGDAHERAADRRARRLPPTHSISICVSFSVTRPFQVRFGLWRVQTNRTVRGFPAHSPSLSPDTVSTTPPVAHRKAIASAPPTDDITSKAYKKEEEKRRNRKRKTCVCVR